ncbi:hypothetical protein [Rhizobium laguerreae]|uniref:hypothetical protein n=1 Tax=Rhizobium laguerreae TaxID=1076926 RepID=UPI003CCEF08F
MARALLVNPKLLICDEILSALAQGKHAHALRTSSPSYNRSPIPTRRIGLSKDHYVSRPPAMLHQRPAGIGCPFVGRGSRHAGEQELQDLRQRLVARSIQADQPLKR